MLHLIPRLVFSQNKNPLVPLPIVQLEHLDMAYVMLIPAPLFLKARCPLIQMLIEVILGLSLEVKIETLKVGMIRGLGGLVGMLE